MNEIVSINVGGKVFQLTNRTIKEHQECVFNLMFNSDTGFKEHTRDKDGNIFVDRSPELFKKVLYSIRTGHKPLYCDISQELLDEYEYWCPGWLLNSDNAISTNQFANGIIDDYMSSYIHEGLSRTYYIPSPICFPSRPEQLLCSEVFQKEHGSRVETFDTDTRIPLIEAFENHKEFCHHLAGISYTISRIDPYFVKRILAARFSESFRHETYDITHPTKIKACTIDEKWLPGGCLGLHWKRIWPPHNPQDFTPKGCVYLSNKFTLSPKRIMQTD